MIKKKNHIDLSINGTDPHRKLCRLTRCIYFYNASLRTLCGIMTCVAGYIHRFIGLLDSMNWVDIDPTTMPYECN